MVGLAVGAEGGLGDSVLLNVHVSGISAACALGVGQRTLRDEDECLDDHARDCDLAPNVCYLVRLEQTDLDLLPEIAVPGLEENDLVDSHIKSEDQLLAFKCPPGIAGYGRS